MSETTAVEERLITRLEVQKRRTDHASVYVNGAFAFGVHQDLVLQYGLHEGRALSTREQQRIERDDEALRAKAAALGYLAHKPRTEGEVPPRLAQRDYGAAAIDEAVARLRELDYVDDAAYAQDYVRARFASKGYGPVRIRRELAERDVAAHLIDRALEEQMDAEKTLEAARGHARKKWKRLRGEDDPRRRQQKLYDYLWRRGFTTDTIRRVMDELEHYSGTRAR